MCSIHCFNTNYYIFSGVFSYFFFNFFCRVQQESVDDAERNRSLVNYVDYAFDDFGGRQPPVYLGLSTVWGSLARSKVTATHLQKPSLISFFLIKFNNVVFFLCYYLGS